MERGDAIKPVDSRSSEMNKGSVTLSSLFPMLRFMVNVPFHYQSEQQLLGKVDIP